MNAIRHATQRGIHELQKLGAHNNSDNIFLMKNRSSPLTIQGLRTNPKGNFKRTSDDDQKLQLTLIISQSPDAESHILFFDVEGLIFELHSEEYAAMSPTTLEVNLMNLLKSHSESFNTGFSKKKTYVLQAHGLITSTVNTSNTNDASKKISGMLILVKTNREEKI